MKTASGERAFRGKDAVLVPYEPTVRQRALSFLSDPNVVALLMLIGTLGIAVEFYHPGAIVPGALGALSLFLAFVAMRVIPVNVGAVVLVLLGVGLLVAEAYVTAHGVAGLGGAACIVIGTLFFIDKSSPDYHFDPGALTLSPWIVWPTPIVLAMLIGLHGLEGGGRAARTAPARRPGPRRRRGAGALRRRRRGRARSSCTASTGRRAAPRRSRRGRACASVAVDGLTATVVAAAARRASNVA